MTRPPRALVEAWYARLRAAGFRDIEYGRDTNQIDGWTFRGANGAAHVQMPEGFEPRQGLADHPTAVYYRGLEHEGRKLRGRRRVLVLIASNGNAADAGRALDITRRGAAKQARRFAVEIGLLREAHGS